MNRHGELVIVDDTGREREHHRLSTAPSSR
jgi:hypothetical protein